MLKLGKRGELLLDVAAIGFTAMAFQLVWGRAINSPTAHRLRQLPIIGRPIAALAAATNQTYDPAGEE